MVEAGLVRCARCSELIEPNEPWDPGARRRHPSARCIQVPSTADVTAPPPATAKSGAGRANARAACFRVRGFRMTRGSPGWGFPEENGRLLVR